MDKGYKNKSTGWPPWCEVNHLSLNVAKKILWLLIGAALCHEHFFCRDEEEVGLGNIDIFYITI